LVGDVQRHTKVHGGPERALCLYSLEKILALQQEGHPIFPGAIGENLTLTGLDWDLLLPGQAATVWPDVLVEITSLHNPLQPYRPLFPGR
jgi:MOSC domain-containing protein YiiM